MKLARACPFCGCNRVLYQRGDSDCDAAVRCFNCGAAGPGVSPLGRSPKRDAFAAWEARSKPSKRPVSPRKRKEGCE